ncbi:MAG: tetratricopeptide repeat protein [Sideroxydans sp.]
MRMQLFFAGDRPRAFMLLLLTAIVYVPFLNNPLVFDDVSFFDRTVSFYADAHFDFNLRWFPYTTMGVTWVFAGDAPLAYRIQNLLLHGANALLILLLLRLWICLFITEPALLKKSLVGAWVGALVFACHPLAVYGAGYLVQRSILMATFFMLVMQIAYLKGLLEGNWRLMAIAVAAYFVTVFSKEHALLAPAILLPLTWVFRTRIKVSRGVLIAAWGAMILIGTIVVMKSIGVLGKPYEYHAVQMLSLQGAPLDSLSLHVLSLLSQAALFFKYCALMLLPNPAWMSIDMREHFFLSVWEPSAWLGLFAYLIYGGAGVFLLLRQGRLALLGLAMLYPWVLYPIEFSAIRMQEIFVLYRAYLWLPGYMLLWVLLVTLLPKVRLIWLSALVFLAHLPFAWNRLWVMSDNYRLWDDAVQLLQGEDRVGAQRIYYGRAFASLGNLDFEKANADFRRSLSLDPSNDKVHMMLAKSLYQAGQYREAVDELTRMIELDQNVGEAFFRRAVSQKALGNVEAAELDVRRSCELGYTFSCAAISLSKSRLSTSRPVVDLDGVSSQ